MDTIKNSIAELVGSTPMLETTRFFDGRNGCRILVKLEYLNPAGSVKDRVALSMLDEAEKNGQLKPGGLIIEPTSGNTGIGLAAIAASRGYRAIFTMPETMSVERRSMLKAYGAEIVLTSGSMGMAGAIAKAEELHRENHGSFLAGQFENPANPKAHYETTGPEIWKQSGGDVDVFVAGVGTGGTLTGVGRYLREKKPEVQIVAMEPETSPMLSQGKSGAHGIQGIGAGFVPKVLDTQIFNKVITISDAAAYEAARRFARKEGILVGISSGGALSAAEVLASQPENTGKTIVTILPDTGDRYLSTPLFSHQ